MANSSLLGCIIQALWEEWSGTIDVNVGDQTVGQVVMAQGKVAWATSVAQTENLASLVWRLSHITADELSDVSRLYYKNKGKKKIGAILEEQGLISRPVLRRCLMLHIRFALANLFAHPGATMDPRPEALQTDDEILFLPEEVLPFSLVSNFARDWINRNKNDDYWEQVSAEAYLLRPLFELPGYLASAVVSAHGGVLVAHRRIDWLEPRILGVLVASMLETSMDLSSAIELGQARATMVECTEGLLVARWVDRRRQFACVVMTDNYSNFGLIQSGLNRLSSSIVSWLKEVLEPAADPG